RDGGRRARVGTPAGPVRPPHVTGASMTAPPLLDHHVLGRVLRWLLLASAWVWLGFALLAVGLNESNARTVGVTESVVASLGVTPRQFLFAFAITLIASWFVPHVASGRTRRSLVTACAAAVLVTAAVYAALLTLAFQLERPVYERRGWPLEL